MKPNKLKNTILLFAVWSISGITLYSCGSGSGTVGATDPASSDSSIFSFPLSSAIPADVDTNASDTALAAYAWQEFLALNWKAAYGEGGPKGEPDNNWSYGSDPLPFPGTVVWETYAHRTELSPFTYPMRPFDSPANYSYQYTPKPGSGSASFKLLHNLDETSEIGSCNLFAFANSQNLYTDKYLVRYQAKTNRVEYDYIRDSFQTATALNTAVTNRQKYMQLKYKYPDSSFSEKMTLRLPNGSIEVKSAWRELNPAVDDSTKFFRRHVIVYSDTATKDTFSYYNKTYALIGLHIIHKTKNHPSFVFATWEHVGVVSQDSMQYILLTQNFNRTITDSLNYMQPIRNRIPTIDSLATVYVHNKLLPKTSVWRNYRLVGVQGTPTSDSTKPNFFLANYVVESDSLLARFHGSGFAHPFDKKNNVYYNNGLYSVGGCQGCHGGGAQHNGFDFSFIVNSPNQAPDAVAGAPTGNGKKVPAVKLARLKQKFNSQ